MNNIFLKNLAALSQKNPELVKKLQSFIPTDLPQLVQKNGTYNILYKGKLIHNHLDPLGEANEIFSKAENSPISIHLIYGIGLGYLFQLTCQNSKGTVILYEPDLNILWLACTLVDFSDQILKSNVLITTTFENFEAILYKKSGIKNNTVLLSLPSQRDLDLKGFEDFVKNLKILIGAFALDLKFTQQKFYPSLKMLLQNVPNLIKEIPLAKFKDAYKGKTAVVVSAGPTLDKNIETLKKYRDRYILFTVGTAVKTLYANNIKPDFLCIIETYNSSKQVEGLDLKDVYFITEPYANPALRNFQYKRIFSHISSNNPINQFWSEIIDEKINDYLSKGTVSYTALNSARILGCSKIILVGQDLAYVSGQCYSKDSAYKDLFCEFNKETNNWEIKAKDFEEFSKAISTSPNPTVRANVAKQRLQNLNSSLYYVKGINGDMIPTESVYATFIRPLQDFTLQFNNIEYINTSLVGAQIDGFKNLSLEEALKDSDPIKNIELHTDFEYDKPKILNNLKNRKQELQSIKTQIEEGQRLSKGLNNDIKRYNNTNKEVLKTLKKLTLNYMTLIGDCAKKSKIFDSIIVADKINLDYEMKIIQEFNIETITNIHKKLAIFYENTENKIKEIERLINESINSAS